MQVRQFMTASPFTTHPGASIASALATMDEHAVRHLPVVEDERLAGVISDRDLLGVSAKSVLADANEARAVRDVMHTDVVTVHPDDEAVAAAVEVSVRGIGCLPVVDSGKLVGIVSEMDLVRLVSESANARKSGVANEVQPTVESLGVRDAVTVTTSATLGQVDELMSAKGFRHVPVVDGETLAGIVSDRDLRRAAGRGADGHAAVTELMTRNVARVARDCSVADAAAMMREHKISALVVVSGSDGIGIVTTTDVLEYALNSL